MNGRAAPSRCDSTSWQNLRDGGLAGSHRAGDVCSTLASLSAQADENPCHAPELLVPTHEGRGEVIESEPSRVFEDQPGTDAVQVP